VAQDVQEIEYTLILENEFAIDWLFSDFLYLTILFIIDGKLLFSFGRYDFIFTLSVKHCLDKSAFNLIIYVNY